MENNSKSPHGTPPTVTFRSLSANEMIALGTEQVAYVKPVVVNGAQAYAIHSADGQMVAMAPNRAMALAAVRQNELEPVSVH